jgi:DNA-directed RNA polymerase subunit M/transcription elongation factor TFIIS
MSITARDVSIAIRKSLQTKFSASESKKIEASIITECIAVSKQNNITLTDIYYEFVYQKVGELLTYPHLKDEILKDVQNHTSGWETVSFLEFRENEKRDTQDQISGMKVQKGAFRCKNKTCGSYECLHYTSQTRGCDEGGTTYIVCSQCGERYTIS